MRNLRAKDIIGVFENIFAAMEDNRDYLIQLDGNTGDGDLGLTMTQGFGKIRETLQDGEETDIGKIILKAGMTMAQAVPSTMGTLVATGLMRGGKAIVGKEEMDISVFTEMLDNFMTGVMERGKARPGERTLIDSLYPAVCDLKESADVSLTEGMEIALDAAQKGVEATKSMEPVHGRAIYHKEKAAGVPDQGAIVGMLFIRGFADYVHKEAKDREEAE